MENVLHADKWMSFCSCFELWICGDTDDGQNILHDCYGGDYTDSYVKSYWTGEESTERESRRAKERQK